MKRNGIVLMFSIYVNVFHQSLDWVNQYSNQLIWVHSLKLSKNLIFFHENYKSYNSLNSSPVFFTCTESWVRQDHLQAS